MTTRSTVGYVVSDIVPAGRKPKHGTDSYTYVWTFGVTEDQSRSTFERMGFVFDEKMHVIRQARLVVSFT